MRVSDDVFERVLDALADRGSLPHDLALVLLRPLRKPAQNGSVPLAPMPRPKIWRRPSE
jgi:hypothetical protein